MREPHRREARLLDRGEIPAAALDVKDVLLVARHHTLTHLDGRIAAAVQYQGVVASEQTRRIDAELKVSREARRFRVVPERFHVSSSDSTRDTRLRNSRPRSPQASWGDTRHR